MKIKGTWIERPHKMAGTALCCTACGWKNLLETRCCPNCGAEMETEDGMVVVFELNDNGTYTRALRPLPDKVGEETDDKDKLKSIEDKLDQLGEKIHQLELSRTVIETRPTYPWVTPPSISVYAGPEPGPYSISSTTQYILQEGSDTNGDST